MLNDPADLLSIFLRGALGVRGRKSAVRAGRFLSGHRGFLTASTLLAAAGVAWGVYDHVKAQQGSPTPPGSPLPPVPGAHPVPSVLSVPAVPARSPVLSVPSVASPSVPSMPVPSVPSVALRLIRLAVSAARADGALAPAERALILEHARAAGIEETVASELDRAVPLAEIVAGVTDDQHRRDLYVLAFTIVRADESVTGAERIYLSQLAHRLGLAREDAAALEAETASKIDAEPDTIAPE